MTTSEVVGQHWAGLNAQLTHFAWKKRWNELELNVPFVYTTDIITSGEYLRPVRVTLQKIDAQVALISLEDLLDTELKEKQLSYLGVHANAGYWIYNRVDKIWYLSQQARELLELDAESNSRTELLALLGERLLTEDWTALQATIDKALSAPNEFAHHIRVKTSKGIVSLEITGQSMGNDLQVTHVIGTIKAGELKSTIASENPIFDRLSQFSIEQSTDLIFWTRPDATYIYVNQAVVDCLEYERKKLLSMPIREVVPEFTDEARDQFWSRLRKEHSFEQEFSFYSRTGKKIELQALINYLNIDGEEVACSFCRDITERKKSETRQRLIEFTVDHSKDLILWTQPDGFIHFASETFLLRTGFSRQEIEGQPIHHFFQNSSSEMVRDFWQKLREKKQMELETQLLLKVGNYIPVHVRLNYLVYEGQEYDCIYLRDWSKKKERDVLVKLSREALDKTKDAIVWLEEDLTVRYLNQSMLRLLNAPPDAYLGKSYHQLFRNVSQREFKDGNLIDFKLEPEVIGERSGAKVAKSDGGSRQIELKCTLITYEDKLYYMLNGRDVTKRLQREADLQTAFSVAELEKKRLQEENLTLREDASENYNVNNIITVSAKYKRVLKQISQVADVDTTVLITGETGTGKELLARAVHQLSEREGKPMVKVNCAALPENLIESELFGHEKGAFTGASGRKKGRFEMADGGTIFLDEIGELPLLLQSKLLRVLQEGEFERLGGTETIKVDARLIAATNRNLKEMVANGNFREDLYYRLNVFPIYNLPLRERPEDIPVLVDFFVKKFSKQQGKAIRNINTADVKRLEYYHFPGNIRELENILERAVVLCDSDSLSIPLDLAATEATTKSAAAVGHFLTFEEMQRQYIIDALKATGGRITGEGGAGLLLNLNDRTLMSKMRKLGIQKRDYIV